MTNEEFERMKKLGFEYTWQFLEVLQEGARYSGLEENSEYISISDYLEEKESYKK